MMNRDWNDSSVKQLIERYSSEYGNDPIEIVRSLARDLVLKSYTKGWIGPPYNMVELAKLWKISIGPNDNVLDGRLIPKANNKFAIEYNPRQSESRINFSIAHEIAHTFFPDCADKVRNRYSKEEIEIENNWQLEFLCNVAASELLLPYAEFSSEANAAPLNLNTIKSLASRYNASIESVFLRFTEVVDKPCTIVIANYGMDGNLEVEYCKASSTSGIVVKRGIKIDPSSIAYSAIRPGMEKYTDGNNSETFDNQECAVFSIGLGSLKNNVGLRVGMFLIPKESADLPETLIRQIIGDATQPIGEGDKIIVQVVNSSAALGSGFGKAISKKYPETKNELNTWKADKSRFKLGNIQMIRVKDDTWVCQLFAQKGLIRSETEIPLKYWALRESLIKLSNEAEDMNASIHMPAIGAGEAGGDWKVIEGMIHSELISKGISVTVYFLNSGSSMRTPAKKEGTLSLFGDN